MTQHFVLQSTKLTGRRYLSSCAALQKQDGPIVVAVAGGNSK